MGVKTSSLAKYFSIFAYFWLLMLAYSELAVFGSFNLEMYTYSFSAYRLLIAHCALLIFAFLVPSKPLRASEYFLWFHLVFPLVPILVFYSFSGGSDYFIFLCAFAFFVISLFVRKPVVVRVNLLRFQWATAFIWVMAILLTLFVLANGDYLSLDYSWGNIYSNRAEISANQPAIFEYIHTVLSKSLFPFLLLFYLVKGNKTLFFVTILFSMAVFIISQHRAAFFYPVLTIICYYTSRLTAIRAGWTFVMMFSGIVVFGIVLLQFDYVRLLGDLILRRTFVAPAILNYQYFEFFQTNPHTWFSDSKISFGLIDPVYPVSVPYIIGDYIGLPGGHANSSYLGSGYQQAGWIGIALYALVIGVLLKYLDSIGVAVGSHAFVFAVCASPLLWLINSSDLPGVFLTHGLLCSLVLLWISSGEIKQAIFVQDHMK